MSKGLQKPRGQIVARGGHRFSSASWAGIKKTPRDLDREVVPWPVLAWELVDEVLPLLPCGLGKRDVLADDALAKKTSQGPHL